MTRIGGFGGASSNQVILNVYDLHDNNAILYPWGLGMYHSGVQIGREEYTFAASSGIFTHEPKVNKHPVLYFQLVVISFSFFFQNAPGATFREAVNMGTFKGTSKDIDTILSSLRSQFGGGDYHVLNKNCNAFATEFVKRLVGKDIPSYVNRMAFYGSYFSCCLPPQMSNNSPVDDASAKSPGYSVSGGSGGYSRVSTKDNSTQKSTSSTAATTPSVSFQSAPGNKLGGFYEICVFCLVSYDWLFY
jgi:hypothetical protein